MCDQLLITVSQAAQRLGLGRSFVYLHFIRTGALRSIRVGSARRVLVSDLSAFVERLKSEQDTNG